MLRWVSRTNAEAVFGNPDFRAYGSVYLEMYRDKLVIMQPESPICGRPRKQWVFNGIPAYFYNDVTYDHSQRLLAIVERQRWVRRYQWLMVD